MRTIYPDSEPHSFSKERTVPANIRTGEPGMNPRFVAYAKSQGRAPAEQLKHDESKYPGGIMCGFILWISECKQAFYEADRNAFLDPHTIVDFKAWDKFLGVES